MRVTVAWSCHAKPSDRFLQATREKVSENNMTRDSQEKDNDLGKEGTPVEKTVCIAASEVSSSPVTPDSYSSQAYQRCGDWINARFPLRYLYRAHLTQYYVAKNLNFWYYFGSLSLFVLCTQMLSGVGLAMYYVPTASHAFDSVQHIMRDVHMGWLLRYMHTTGASAFFVVVYLHIYRAMMYGSYQSPRELLWLIGMLLFILLLAEAYTGYVLPWGQMSFWATKVIISLVTAIPKIGPSLSVWLQGDYNVSGVTLHRFFAFHVAVFPLFLIFFIFIHLIALRTVGSNNPDGIDIKKNVDKTGRPLDSVPFHPHFVIKDLWGGIIFLLIAASILFFYPTFHGYFIEVENSIPANPLQTPSHIRPVWYMSPFYAILRAVPSKSGGIAAMGLSIMVFFFLPWLDKSAVKSIRYKGIGSYVGLVLFVVSFLGLGVLGCMAPSPLAVTIARALSIVYFCYFLFMPIYTRYEKTRSVPTRLPK